jgi:hypothetical protein
MMVEEDEDESPQENIDETDGEAQDTCPAFDDNLDSEVDDFTIKEEDHVRWCIWLILTISSVP